MVWIIEVIYCRSRPDGVRHLGLVTGEVASRYPETWRAEANCENYGCAFNRLSLQSCLALGDRMGAREVHHGTSNGGRANECWLLNSCGDLRPNTDFTVYRR